MQYSQEHLKTMVYAEFGGQTECIMGNWKIENVCCETFLLMQIYAFFFFCSVRSCATVLAPVTFVLVAMVSSF